MGKRKIRYCKICGDAMPRDCLWVCHGCQAAGMGQHIKIKGEASAEDLLAVARARTSDPLDGMTAEDVEALSHCFKQPYNTYGKLRGYVSATGQLPPKNMERSDRQCRRR